jgi:hypothetical protein
LPAVSSNGQALISNESTFKRQQGKPTRFYSTANKGRESYVVRGGVCSAAYADEKLTSCFSHPRVIHVGPALRGITSNPDTLIRLHEVVAANKVTSRGNCSCCTRRHSRFVRLPTRCWHIGGQMCCGKMQIAVGSKTQNMRNRVTMRQETVVAVCTVRLCLSNKAKLAKAECWPKANPQLRYRPEST